MKYLSMPSGLLSLFAVCFSISAHAIIVADITQSLQQDVVSVGTSGQQLNSHVVHSQSQEKPVLHDYQTLFNTSNIFNVSLSPNGQWLSYFAKRGTDNKRVISLWIYDIKNGKPRKLFTTKQLKKAVWTADSLSLFLDTGRSIAVTTIDKGAAPHVLFNKNRRHHDGIVNIDYFHKDSAVVRQWHQKTKQYQIKRITHGGDSHIIYQSPQRFMNFGLDYLGQPSFVVRQNDAADNQGERYIVDVSSPLEKVIWQCQWDDKCRPIYFDKKRQMLWLTTNKDGDFNRLAKVDISSGKLTTVHSDPQQRADYAGALFEFNDKTQQLYAPVISYHGDYNKYYALDNKKQSHLDFISQQLSSSSYEISSSIGTDLAQQPWLITDHDNRYSAAKYYLYNPVSKTLTRPLQQIIKQANASKKLLPSKDIAKKFAINYYSRDGFLINGYLTLPLGTDISTAPLVTNVHGGPWSRVTEHYSRSAQMLANRGYIVFEPNFRSSTGFGKTYQNSTAGEHGDGRIQQDIIDGVHFLLKHNIGDEKRLAVIGHSFGAYSTLAALAFTPDLFQVGFAGAPPHDIGRSAKLYYRFTKKTNSFSRQYFMKKMVVDWDDKQAMADNYQRSPAANASKIKKPLIMWAGKNDRRVFIADVKNYALTIEEMGKQVSLFIDPKAMHSPSSKLGLYAYQYLVEKSLADHIGGAIKPLDPNKDKKLWRFLNKNLAIDHNDLLK